MAIVAATLGLVVAIGIVEVALRVFDPIGRSYEGETLRYFVTAIDYAWASLPPAQPPALPEGLDLDGRGFSQKPNLDMSLGSFRLRTNSLGCRGPEIDVPKPADVFRIVLLGDSVAFGWGVDDEVTFARRLETGWNAGEHARRLEVLNTALPKYDTNQEEATLRELGLGLEPDLVLLVYVVNDIDPTRDTLEHLLTGRPPHPEEQVTIPDDVWSWSSDRLRPVLPAIAALIGTYTDLAARVQRILPEGTRYRPETFGAGPRGWPRSQASLLRIQAMCKQANVPFVLFDHTKPQIESLPPFCREHRIDYEPFWFREQDFAEGITNSWLDSHANARGHEILLERMRAALERRGLLPKH